MIFMQQYHVPVCMLVRAMIAPVVRSVYPDNIPTALFAKTVVQVTRSRPRPALTIGALPLFRPKNRYLFYWYLMQDGRIEFEIKLSGELSTNLLSEGENPDSPDHGVIVAPGVNAQLHQVKHICRCTHCCHPCVCFQHMTLRLESIHCGNHRTVFKQWDCLGVQIPLDLPVLRARRTLLSETPGHTSVSRPLGAIKYTPSALQLSNCIRPLQHRPNYVGAWGILVTVCLDAR